jgi:hypothetical protein
MTTVSARIEKKASQCLVNAVTGKVGTDASHDLQMHGII